MDYAEDENNACKNGKIVETVILITEIETKIKIKQIMNIADFLLLFEYAANFDRRKRGKMMINDGK